MENNTINNQVSNKQLSKQEFKTLSDKLKRKEDKIELLQLFRDDGYIIEGYNDGTILKKKTSGVGRLADKIVGVAEKGVDFVVDPIKESLKGRGQKIKDATAEISQGITGLTKEERNSRPAGDYEDASVVEPTKNSGTERFRDTLQGVLRTAGSIAGGVGDVIGGATVAPVINAAPDEVKEVIGTGVQKATDFANDKLGEDNVENIGAASNIIDIAGLRTSFAKSAAKAGAKSTLKGAVNVADDIIPPSGGGGGGGGNIGNTIKATEEVVADIPPASKPKAPQGTTIVGDAISMITDPIKNIARNIKTNVVEGIKQQRDLKIQIEKLPPKAQPMARAGLDIQEVNSLSNMKDTNVLKEMFNRAKIKDLKITTGSPDPADLVGEPIRKSIQALKEKSDIIGEALGEESRNLVRANKLDMSQNILNKVKGISGLGEIKINKYGEFDFSGTSLDKVLNKSEIDTLNTAFRGSLDSKNLHNYRKTLRDLLDKDKNPLKKTDTTFEKAIEGIRSGILKTIEDNNPNYKILSQEYATLNNPLDRLKKLGKNLDVANDEDILDMAGANIARRINSNAPSKIEIIKVLREIDDKLGGRTLTDVQERLDALDVLDKYYDITPSNSLKGQTGSAIEKSLSKGGLMDRAVALGDKSKLVKQKAIQDFINSLSNR